MTNEEREKLIEDMANAFERTGYDVSTINSMAAALAIAEAAFAEKIEAAYKEGWDDKEDKFHITSFEHTWKTSNARRAILASIPEKNDD